MMRRHRSSGTGLVLSYLALAGCSEDGSNASEESATDAATEASDSGASSSGEESGDDDDEDVTGIDPDYEQIPARDIQISNVFINQGNRITVVENGNYVAPETRSTEIIRDRPALVRAYWHLADGFEPRRIQARLFLTGPSGEETMKSHVVEVSGPSEDRDLATTFGWILEPEDVQPNTTFRIELWEAEAGQEDKPEPNPLPVSPIDGTTPLLGIGQTTMNLSVTIVPVAVQFGQCNNSGELSEEMVEGYATRMYEWNPLSTLDLRVAPVGGTLTSPLRSMADLWGYGFDQKAADGGSGTQYYYVTADMCTGDVDGAGGMAGGGGVSSGVIHGGSHSYRMMAHEVGHTQGLPHAPGCGAAGASSSYPHEDGHTGVWGFGILEYSLHDPKYEFDYMGYCSPQWVSDWSWGWTGDSIARLSGPSAGGPDTRAPVLVGLELPDGRQEWYTDRRSLEPMALPTVEHEFVDIVNRDGSVWTAEATRNEHHDGTIEVVIPTAEDFDDTVVEVRRVGPRQDETVGRGRINMRDWDAR